MKWYNLIKKFLNTIKQDRTQLSTMRDDINSNTGECTKLLYRLEECELQVKLNKALIVELEARKQDKYNAT